MNASDILADVLAIIGREASGAEGLVRVELGRARNTRFAVNEITTAGDADTAQVSVTLALQQKHATVTSNRIDEPSLITLVKRALELTRLAPDDPEWVGVVGGSDTPGRAAEAPPLPTEFGGALARKVIAAADGKGVSSAGFFEAHDTRIAIGTTQKRFATYARSFANFSVTARTTDGTGSGWAGASEADANKIDGDRIGGVAIDKAVRSAKPQPLKPNAYKVVLEPEAVGDLLGFLVDSMDQRSADEGRSFFSKKGGGNRIGERLFAKGLSLVSDPSSADTPAAPFDEDGLPLKARTLIDDGLLKELLVSRYWAKQKKLEATGSPTAVHLLGGKDPSVEALVGKVDRGLLVTRFWYTRWLDPQSMTITGLTRDGIFLIESGKVTQPVQNFRFNESPAHFFANAKFWTKETFRVINDDLVMRVPAILSEDFHMASVSQAV